MAAREGLTEICSSGNTRRASSAQAVTSTSTRRSKLRERSSSSQMMRETSPGARPWTRIWVEVSTWGSAIEGSVTEMRLMRSVVLISRDLSTMTRSGAETGGADCGGSVGWVVGGGGG